MTITSNCVTTRSTWVVIFFSIKASISTLTTLNYRFSNSLRLRTQAIFASRPGLAITSIVSFFDASNSPCTLAKKHLPSLDIVDIDVEACNVFAWGGKNPFEQACSIYDLLVKAMWPTQSTSNLLHSTKMPFPKANEIVVNDIRC